MHARETRKPRLFRPRPAPAQPLIWLYLVATLVLALVFALAPARASEFDPEPEPEAEGLQMKIGDEWVATLAMDTTVDMQVRGLLAEVTVRQTYRNDASEWREGRYLLPLPENGAVGALTLRVGERLIVGEIREKAEAEAIYQAAAASGQRASLVSQNRPNLFQTAVANIGPGEEVEIEVRYWQPVAYRDGVFSLGLPLTLTTRYLPAPSPDASFAMHAMSLEAPEALPAVAGSLDGGVAAGPTVALVADIDAQAAYRAGKARGRAGRSGRTLCCLENDNSPRSG